MLSNVWDVEVCTFPIDAGFKSYPARSGLGKVHRPPGLRQPLAYLAQFLRQSGLTLLLFSYFRLFASCNPLIGLLRWVHYAENQNLRRRHVVQYQVRESLNGLVAKAVLNVRKPY